MSIWHKDMKKWITPEELNRLKEEERAKKELERLKSKVDKVIEYIFTNYDIVVDLTSGKVKLVKKSS